MALSVQEVFLLKTCVFQETQYPANIIDPVFVDPVERTNQTPGQWGEICLNFQNDMLTCCYVKYLEFAVARVVENVSVVEIFLSVS